MFIFFSRLVKIKEIRIFAFKVKFFLNIFHVLKLWLPWEPEFVIDDYGVKEY